jgi:hypothetical protein
MQRRSDRAENREQRGLSGTVAAAILDVRLWWQVQKVVVEKIA